MLVEGAHTKPGTRATSELARQVSELIHEHFGVSCSLITTSAACCIYWAFIPQQPLRPAWERDKEAIAR
jgi:hypothetical protein